MRRTWMVTVSLVAALAVSAAGVATASAAQPVFTNKLVGKLGAVTLNTKSKKGVTETVVCKKGTATGTLPEGSSFTENMTYAECKSNGGATPCGNVAGESIETGTLGAELFYLNKAETTKGLVAGGSGFSFKCGTETVEVQGEIIGSIANSKTGFSVKYKVSTKTGKQEFESIFIEGEEVGPFFWGTEKEGEIGVLHESTLSSTETLTTVTNVA